MNCKSEMHRAVGLAAAVALAIVAPAWAQQEVERNPPASSQNPAAEHAPTNRVDKALPTMESVDPKAPEPLPATKGVGQALPQMQAPDTRWTEQNEIGRTREPANPAAAFSGPPSAPPEKIER